jgi:hypothetical protein
MTEALIKNGITRCNCASRGQPYARPNIAVGRTITCRVHTARWMWDGVAFIPDGTYGHKKPERSAG